MTCHHENVTRLFSVLARPPSRRQQLPLEPPHHHQPLGSGRPLEPADAANVTGELRADAANVTYRRAAAAVSVRVASKTSLCLVWRREPSFALRLHSTEKGPDYYIARTPLYAETFFFERLDFRSPEAQYSLPPAEGGRGPCVV